VVSTKSAGAINGPKSEAKAFVAVIAAKPDKNVSVVRFIK
ncbi:MAG: hypothetical protein ACI94O_002607, partial [Octadecabacter sp.]